MALALFYVFPINLLLSGSVLPTAVTSNAVANQHSSQFISCRPASVCYKIHVQSLFMPAFGRHTPGFLKLLLSGKSVCVFVCVHP